MDSSQHSKDVQTYKDLAKEGMDLMFPVRLKGKCERSDIKLIYHMTIMLFDTDKDKSEDAHNIAKRLSLNPPNPKEVGLEMSTMQGRTGYTMHIIKLLGPRMKEVKALHDSFSKMGFEEKHEFTPHITVDQETWECLKKENPKNCFEAGIEFLPAELRRGDKLLASYKPTRPTDWGFEYPAEDKLRASEKMDVDLMRETIWMNPDISLKHGKAVTLSPNFFQNYIQDNPGLEEQLLKKHEERVAHHFSTNPELQAFALKYGIKRAYDILRKK